MQVIEESENLKRRKVISVALLVAGICLSQFFLLWFNLSYGFKFDGVEVYFPFPLIRIGDGSMEQIKVTSSITGYLCFLIFLIFNYKKAKERNHTLATVAIVICAYCILHEGHTFMMALHDEFTGDPVMLGWVLLLICVKIFYDLFQKNRN